VQILDHKGRVASADYFLLNPLTTVDCIDTKASGVSWNDINPVLIESCKKLVIKVRAVPEDRHVFRPTHAPFIVLVRSTLAEALGQAEFVGLRFRDPVDFQGS
jgi:hypothetical protein